MLERKYAKQSQSHLWKQFIIKKHKYEPTDIFFVKVKSAAL